ncbi:MAG: ABC transporter ATP-binding protein [Bdellovibrionota bacterium]
MISADQHHRVLAVNIVELQQIQFIYSSSSNPVLDIDSLILKKGEKVFLYGPSGCGKTTLLEILSGVLVPQSGKVSILQKDLAQSTAADRDQFRGAHIGYIFQSLNLIPYLNVQENITLPLYLSKQRRSKVAASNEASELQNICTRLGISNLLLKPVSELSVGQQQRVAVARAMLGKPKLILADEPTSALDHDLREKFIRLLFEVCSEQQTTVLFVSHDRTLSPLFDRSISLPAINKVVTR